MKEKAKQISDNNRSLKRKKKKNVVKQMLSGFQHSKDTSNVAADEKENLLHTPEQPTMPNGQLRMSKRGTRNGLAIDDKENKQREKYPTLNGIQVGEAQNDETNSEEKLAKEEIYESRKLLIRQMQGMIAKSQHKNNRQSAKKRNTKAKGGEVVSEYDSWSDLEENFAKAYEPIPLNINMDTWRKMSKNDILKSVRSQQMRKDFEYMSHSEILGRIDSMQKSAKYLSEKFGVNHLLSPPFHNGVEHNHPPLDSLLSSLVMPMNHQNSHISFAPSVPPTSTKMKPNSPKSFHREEEEGDESSVISNFSSNIPPYVSRSEILKVYDELPAAHKRQGSNLKNKSNHKNDPNYIDVAKEDYEQAQHPPRHRHHSKQHGSWSSRASSIMHNPESIYISREEVLRNFQKSNGEEVNSGYKKQQKKRVHDSWSSRASSILAKVNEGQEPNYVSRSQLVGKITGNKNRTALSREDVLKNLEASIAEGAGIGLDEMETNTSGSSSTFTDSDSGSDASTVKNVKLKSRVELPEQKEEQEFIRKNSSKPIKSAEPYNTDKLSKVAKNLSISHAEKGGINYENSQAKPNQQFENGHLMRAEDIQSINGFNSSDKYSPLFNKNNVKGNKNKTGLFASHGNEAGTRSRGFNAANPTSPMKQITNNRTVWDKSHDYRSYDRNNNSDDGASSFCSCSSCEYYTDCSCCKDEEMTGEFHKGKRNATDEEGDDAENELRSCTTTDSSADTIFELGRDKGNKNITNVIKNHKDVYVVNFSEGSGRSKNSARSVARKTSTNYDPIPKQIGTSGKWAGVKQKQLLALTDELEIAPSFSDEPELIKKTDIWSSPMVTSNKIKDSAILGRENHMKSHGKSEKEANNNGKGSWSNADFEKMYEPVNATVIRKQQNRRALKRYLKELAVEWDHAIDDLNTLRRGQVLKELRYYIKEAVNVDTAQSPEDIGKQVEVALRDAMTSNFEAISNVNIGQMYVPMEENPNNSKVVSRENTDYDTFGSIDSLIFEPKIPTHEDIKEAQEEIEQHFEYLDDLDGNTLYKGGSVTGPGKTTFAERVKLFQNLEKKKPKPPPPVQRPPSKKITFLDVKGQETSWKEVAKARMKPGGSNENKSQNVSTKQQSTKSNLPENPKNKIVSNTKDTSIQNPSIVCNGDDVCNYDTVSLCADDSLIHKSGGACSMCQCNCAQCRDDGHDHEKELNLVSSEREPTSGLPTSNNFSSDAVSWAFLGNNNNGGPERHPVENTKRDHKMANKVKDVASNENQSSEPSKPLQKDLRHQLKEAFGASFPYTIDEASNVLTGNSLETKGIDLGDKSSESKDGDTLIYSSEIEMNVDHGVDFLSEYAMRKDLFEDSLSFDNSATVLKGGKKMHLTQENFRGELQDSLKKFCKGNRESNTIANGDERSSRLDGKKNKKSSSEMGDSGIGSPPPAPSTSTNDSNTILVEVQIEHHEGSKKIPLRQDIAEGVASPNDDTSGSDSGLDEHQQQWNPKGIIGQVVCYEEDDVLLQKERQAFADQIQASVNARKLDAKKEPDTMIRELKSKLKEKFNVPSTANSSVASRSVGIAARGSNRTIMTFLDGITIDSKNRQEDSTAQPKEVYECSMYDPSLPEEDAETKFSEPGLLKRHFKKNSNFTPPPTENNSSRCTPIMLSHAKGTAILPQLPNEKKLEPPVGMSNRSNGKMLNMSAKDRREILYGPGGMFGPKGPFSTPSVRYPGGLEVNMPLPPPPPNANFLPNSRFFQKSVNLIRRSPSNLAFHSELSSVAEDRSDGRSQIVANSVFAFTNTADSSRPHSGIGGGNEIGDNENSTHDRNSLAASTTLILEGGSSSASKPPSRMEPYRFCELVGEAARLNIEIGNGEQPSHDLGEHWREEKTQRMMAWISNSQLNEFWGASQYSWWKVRQCVWRGLGVQIGLLKQLVSMPRPMSTQ